jgi:hypothetical protein
VHPRSLKNLKDGTFDLEELKAKVRTEDQHFPRTALVRKIKKTNFRDHIIIAFCFAQVCIENTHNLRTGRALPLPWLKEVFVFLISPDLGFSSQPNQTTYCFRIEQTEPNLAATS